MEFILMLIPLSFFVGWKLHERINGNYKDRWHKLMRIYQEALDDGIIEKKVVVTEKVVERLPQEAATLEIRRRLRKMGAPFRVDAEIARLEKGLPPVDDLNGLGAPFVQEMIENRMEHGWDELGQKIPEKF